MENGKTGQQRSERQRGASAPIGLPYYCCVAGQ
jgi:hypothetical protein